MTECSRSPGRDLSWVSGIRRGLLWERRKYGAWERHQKEVFRMKASSDTGLNEKHKNHEKI